MTALRHGSNAGQMPEAIAAVPGLDENLRIQDKAAQRMKKLRQAHGALSFESMEARAVFDGDTIHRMETEQPNRAKDLIADFMIAANGVTARYLSSRKFPALRRVVRTPKRWDGIVDLARQHGFTLPAEPDPKPLEEFLVQQKAADPLRFPDLSLSVIKLIGPGEYVADVPGEAPSPGHFGLAVADYTHSTAPNRRYPDIVTQRLLKAAWPSSPLPTARTIWSRWQSTARRRRMQPRRWSDRWESRQRPCCWSRKSANGSTPSSPAPRPRARGSASSSRPSKGGWCGFQGLDVGRWIHVQLTHTDVEQGFIDFKRVD